MEKDRLEPFRRALKRSDLSAVGKLLDAGFDVNTRGAGRWTPLILAAIEGNVPALSLLLAKGAAVNEVDNWGVSALAYAALEGRVKAIEVLLQAGASIEVRPHGVSLLEFAQWGGGRFRTRRHLKLLKEAVAQTRLSA